MESEPVRQFDLFVSYASADLPEAEALSATFERRGLGCFLAAKDLSGGDEFAETIRQALINSAEVCILLTPESLKSQWVITEWGAAWALRKRITPILLRSTPDQLPERLKRLQCVDYHNVKEFVSQFRRRLADAYQSQTSRTRAAGVSDELEVRTDTPRVRFDPPGLPIMPDYGPVQHLVDDPSVSEILINSFQEIYVERDHRLIRTDLTLPNREAVIKLAENILESIDRAMNDARPYVDARLDDACRVNIVIPPLTDDMKITIRKPRAEFLSVDEMISGEMMSRDIADFLTASVRLPLNILISGLYDAGATTLLSSLSSFFSPDDRVIVIEDPRELELKHPHVVRLEARPADIEGRGEITQLDLVRNALRMRPDRLIIGEIHGTEVLEAFRGSTSGGPPLLMTTSSPSPEEAMLRLENMILMVSLDADWKAIRASIAGCLNIIVQIVRFPDSVQRISRVSEVCGVSEGRVETQDIFLFRQDHVGEDGRIHGEHYYTGLRPKSAERLEAVGAHFPN